VKAWQIGLMIGLGFAVFSVLPIFRSGQRRGINFWEFAKEHTRWGKSPPYIRQPGEKGRGYTTIGIEIPDGFRLKTPKAYVQEDGRVYLHLERIDEE